ncbi:hypothetical protein ASG87_05775 [Frateuria sp. Soil773]|uniref:hypothetical protein n=1 Tax=Frateuria sp. Soil773 TaxID=1736407 RepID=UPI0006FC9C2E|nr:hypothetical protein [Frateuria sp. Soil773]KRE89052.1 hypothetical protein ASG87_05775 [Frateuria sp. Soil773]
MTMTVRWLASMGLAAAFALAWMTPSWAGVPMGESSMEAVPLLRKALDRAPPKDALEYIVLQTQFDLLGFKAAAGKLDTYEQWRLLSTAMPPPAREAATLREVIAGPDAAGALRATAARIAKDGVAVAFPSGVEAENAPAPELQMSAQGLAHFERLAPGLWGLFKGTDANQASTLEQAEALYIAVDIRNRMATKADIRLQYDLAPGMVLTCEANDVVAADHRYGVCKVPLRGRTARKDGSGWVLLTPEEKASARENLLALRPIGPPAPKALQIRFDALHLAVDTEAGTSNVTLDNAWRAAAETEARMKLQSASCAALGTCASGLAQKTTSPMGILAGLTLLGMICLVAYRVRRGGGAGIWPTLAKLYAMLLVLAVAINVVDRPAGATRGAPLSGTFGFMAKVAVSMPWSYYFVAGVPDTGPRQGLAAKPMADDSPWFWGFAGINLAFLVLMAASSDGRTRNTGSIL